MSDTSDKQLDMHEKILNLKIAASLDDDSLNLDKVIKHPKPYRGLSLTNFIRAKQDALKNLSDHQIVAILHHLNEPLPTIKQKAAPASPAIAPAPIQPLPPEKSMRDQLREKCVRLLGAMEVADQKSLENPIEGFYSIALSDSLLVKT